MTLQELKDTLEGANPLTAWDQVIFDVWTQIHKAEVLDRDGVLVVTAHGETVEIVTGGEV